MNKTFSFERGDTKAILLIKFIYIFQKSVILKLGTYYTIN